MKATGGFFTINRAAQEALIGTFSPRTQANARAVVNYLVTHARWREDAGGLKLDRGELVIGREKTSAAIGMSVNRFRNTIQRLREVEFLTTTPAKKVTTRNRKKSPPGIEKSHHPESHGRATEGLIVTICEYDAYCTPGQKPQSARIEKVTTRNRKKSPPGIEKSNHSRSKYSLKEEDQRHVPVSADGHGKNGKAKAATPPADRDLDAVTKCYQAQIRSEARLTADARTKIKARLRTYSVSDLETAIARFAGDTWWMENNGGRGMAWFFKNDDRIEQYIGLWEVRKKPERAAAAGPVAPEAAAAVEQPATRKAEPYETGEPQTCICPFCRGCTNPTAAGNDALCTRCQSGLCWKEPTPESPQAPIQPHRETNVSPGLKSAYTRVGDLIRKERPPGEKQAA